MLCDQINLHILFASSLIWKVIFWKLPSDTNLLSTMPIILQTKDQRQLNAN